jgi:hypothetical protein
VKDMTNAREHVGREPDDPVLSDHPLVPYVQWQPTPYDLGITDDPEAETEAAS